MTNDPRITDHLTLKNVLLFYEHTWLFNLIEFIFKDFEIKEKSFWPTQKICQKD